MINIPKKRNPEVMNIELTTKCPLRCPQCYCTLDGGKDIELKTAIKWLEQGAEMGVGEVMLSGGETMCYPHIYEIISAVKKLGMVSNIALSGYNFNQQTFEKLIESGVDRIFISLNGSTEEINSMSRDGYKLAVAALKLLKSNSYKNTVINWVMHSSNAHDFPNIIELAEKYSVCSVTIMAVKPDSKNSLHTIPSKEQMIEVRDFVRSYKGNVKINIESCFSPMLALVCDTKLFGNMNLGKNYGCNAGLSAFSVNVDGYLSPCRHLDYFEDYESLGDYWDNSPVLERLRSLHNDRKEPCLSCHYGDYCRHCIAINSKLNNGLFIGNKYCPLSV